MNMLKGRRKILWPDFENILTQTYGVAQVIKLGDLFGNQMLAYPVRFSNNKPAAIFLGEHRWATWSSRDSRRRFPQDCGQEYDPNPTIVQTVDSYAHGFRVTLIFLPK